MTALWRVLCCLLYIERVVCYEPAIPGAPERWRMGFILWLYDYGFFIPSSRWRY